MIGRDPRTEPRGVEAARRVTLEIFTILGDFGEGLTLIGGSAPPVLVGDPKGDPYLGTLDVDVLIDPIEIPEEVYATIGGRLLDRGYVGGEAPFQWLRTVRIDDQDIEVRVDLLAPETDRRGHGHRHEVVDHVVVARRLEGGELVRDSYERREVVGVLPDGRRNRIQIRVAAGASFIVLKALAMAGRDKAKDAYDIDFVLTHVPGGPDRIASDMFALGDVAPVKRALGILRSKYESAEAYGPGGAALYRGALSGSDEAAEVRARAFARVRLLLRRYDEIAADHEEGNASKRTT